MPVFRLASFDGQTQSFAKILNHFLGTLAKSGSLDLVDLRTVEANYGGQTQTDTLLVRAGTPLAAVFIEVLSSQRAVRGYVESPAYQGTGGAESPLASIRTIDEDLAKRMMAEMPEAPAIPEPDHQGAMVEMSWRILIRSPGVPILGWEGGPFDAKKIEEAFNKLVDIIVLAASKQTV